MIGGEIGAGSVLVVDVHAHAYTRTCKHAHAYAHFQREVVLSELYSGF